MKYADLTNLKPDATPGDLRALCVAAKENADVVRAICVNPDPQIIVFCKDILEGSDVKICVVNDFPLGRGGRTAKQAQANWAGLFGAREVDTVINAGLLKECLDELDKKVLLELKEVTSIFPEATKVIIETGHEWYTEKLVKKAAELVAESGAFCVKTSTGFIANIPVEEKVKHVKWMHEAAPDLMIKVAGGIKTMAHARLFWDIVPREKLIFGASASFWKS